MSRGEVGGRGEGAGRGGGGGGQGGCVDGVVHYCVANMPGAVAHTSTWALTHATLPYVLELANKGWRQALKDNAGLRDGLNVCAGKITHRHVAEDLGYDYIAATDVLKQ